MVPLAVYLRVPDSFDHVIKSNPWTDSTLIVPVDRLTIYSTWITPHADKAGVLKSGYYPLKGLKYILFKMIQVISILEKFYYSSVCFPFAPPRKHLGKNTQVRGHTSIAIRVAGKKIGKSVVFCQTPLGPPPRLVLFRWKKLTPIYFVRKCINNGKNKFYAWSQSKTKKKILFNIGPLFPRIL